MKNLLISLLTVIFIASCGTETDSEYPKVFGTWQVNSETDAEWIGIRTKSTIQQADTIEIETPNGHYLTITENPNSETLDFTYIDSTSFNWTQVDLDSTTIEFPEYALPHSGQNLQIGGRGYTIQPERLVFSLDIFWICNRGLEQNPVIWMHFKQNNGNPFRHYRIAVDGLSDALNSIGC